MAPMIDPPVAIVVELTHRCPLSCAYCSNPTELVSRGAELSTTQWTGLIDQAAGLGVLQVHLSGGEPLARADLEAIVEQSSRHGLYTNLITSGVGLSDRRAWALSAAGLRSVQLSFQGPEAGLDGFIAGREAHATKVRAAEAFAKVGLPLTINFVLHRHNIDQLAAMVELGRILGAQRIELANVQFAGWALVNRMELLPSRSHVTRAHEVFLYQRRLCRQQGIELVWVVPDYFSTFPKPCMGGWGNRIMTVAPDGTVLPCAGAASINTLRFETIRSRSLAWIWERSASFNAFRGFDWMAEPCRGCEYRARDFGGCRCQAFALTGDPTRADPVCQWSPDRHLIDQAIRSVELEGDHDLVPLAADSSSKPAMARGEVGPLQHRPRQPRAASHLSRPGLSPKQATMLPIKEHWRGESTHERTH